MNFIKYITSLALITLLFACQKQENDSEFSEITPEFEEYWYSGKAEVATYQLNQSRYGEERKGNATLIFVTEPFSRYKQVKLDHPEKTGNDKVSVMKLNFIKKFNTGIYPYSLMLSAFSPIDLAKDSSTLKVTMSGQEWCGHVFTQMNLRHNQYQVNTYSYFESEADEVFDLDKYILEDEIWNRIKINYHSLPTGKFEMIPGLFYARLLHQPLSAQPVEATLEPTDSTFSYRIKYKDRSLSINFNKEFPHRINSWEETFINLKGETVSTSATFDRMLHIDYWSKNSNKYEYLRDSLHLTF
ncbi:hypothetical protein LVD15_08245 [Fulvivirga maritima]|uniref:hypothetical protein n=1 Tax=Fulvivirga maritima TaxID=2904247 RepID=UPI001F26D977|nr:hypothetical protein [Fulvivirga maritima]UII28406.1 hypothetical protein LVD15_08245 [Fulvivirga maritima]